jgi:hypothetical protein
MSSTLDVVVAGNRKSCTFPYIGERICVDLPSALTRTDLRDPF